MRCTVRLIRELLNLREYAQSVLGRAYVTFGLGKLQVPDEE